MVKGKARIRHARSTPWAALIGVLLLVMAGTAMALYEDHLYQTQRFQEVQEQADILSATVTAALSFDDPRAAQEYVNSMRVNPELEAVGVYTAAGRRLAGFSRPGAARLPRQIGAQAAPEHERLVVVTPVTQQGKTIGAVYVRAIAEPMSKRLVRYFALGLLLIMGAIMVAGLGSAQISLSRANRTLEEQARELTDANTRLQAEMEERAKVEEALRQSQKMEAIGQLSGGIAHDFNNLLTIVKGNLQRLKRKLAQGRPDAGRHIDAALEGADRAAVLTQRILAFSRKQALTPSPVDLNALIRGMKELIRNSVREDIAVNEELTAQWWTVCDPSQMENVILNLVINARDAMPLGGKILVRTEHARITPADAAAAETQPGDYVKLTVRDNGQGMSEEVRQKALEPFFTTKAPGQGTGLGLSMIFGFVRQSGGDLRLDSTPGNGTTVTILMPRAPQASAGTDDSSVE